MQNFDSMIGNMRRAEEQAESLGAGNLGKALAAGAAANDGKRYRVRYGYINENRASYNDPLWRDEQYIDASDLNDAMAKYKQLGWLKERDPKGRRFASIQTTSQEDEKWENPRGNWFYDHQ